MEIKNVVNEVRNDYPKMNEMSKTHLHESIPNKWLKAGLSSLGITFLTENSVFASSGIKIGVMPLAGAAESFTPGPVQIGTAVCSIAIVISFVTVIAMGLSILTTKIKAKKQSEKTKVKKSIKITFIVSIAIFIISLVASIVLNKITL